MWSANEFFYSPSQSGGSDVYTPDAPPRGYYHLPEVIADVDEHHRPSAASPDMFPPGHNRPHSPYASPPMDAYAHGQLPLPVQQQLPAGYAGATPLVPSPHDYAADPGVGSHHAHHLDLDDFKHGSTAAAAAAAAAAATATAARAASHMGHQGASGLLHGASSLLHGASGHHQALPPAYTGHTNAAMAAPSLMGSQPLPAYTPGAPTAASLMGSQLPYQPAYTPDYRNGAAAPFAASQQPLPPAVDYRNGAAAHPSSMAAYAGAAPAAVSSLAGAHGQAQAPYTDYMNGGAGALAGSQHQPLAGPYDYRHVNGAAAPGVAGVGHNRLPAAYDYRSAAAPSIPPVSVPGQMPIVVPPAPHSSTYVYSSPASLPPITSSAYPSTYAHPGAATSSAYPNTYAQSAAAAAAQTLPLAQSNFSPKTVELQVPLCCEGCGDRIKDALIDLEGVRGVSLDFEQEKVTIVGNVNAEQALKQVKALKPKGAHRLGTKKIMYRNM